MSKGTKKGESEHARLITAHDDSKPQTATATRTLVTAGFSITNSHRQRTHIEIQCERADIFGIAVHYLFAVCDQDQPPQADLANIRKEANRTGRTLVLVCRVAGPGWISWRDFLDSLGGAVPSWRAIGPGYDGVLNASAANKVPSGYTGEAWQIFEDAVADGFEFLLGNRVNRLGGRTRGKRVSDMITETPDRRVLVLDAKASQSPFNVTWPQLRPLVEYTHAQVARQRGHNDVHGAVLLAKEFKQDSARLSSLSSDFLTEARVPLTFVKTGLLSHLVSILGSDPQLRSSVAWRRIFCPGGLLTRPKVVAEVEGARRETYPRGRPVRS